MTSNAKDNPSLRISMGGTVLEEISISTQFLRLTGSKKGTDTDIILSTQKKDLKITDVTFKPRAEMNPSPGWQSSLPVFIKYTLTKKDSVRADGYIDYTLRLNLTYNEKETRQGDILIKTNHPKKDELTISGMIEGVQ